MGSSSGGGSNPKYPGITGYKMMALWQEIKLGLAALWKASRGLISYRDQYTSFREKWGVRPPRSDRDWLQFWQEFVSLEDALSDSSTNLLDAYNEMRIAADEGVEVVKMNGFDDEGAIADPLAFQERSLNRVRDILKILN